MDRCREMSRKRHAIPFNGQIEILVAHPEQDIPHKPSYRIDLYTVRISSAGRDVKELLEQG
jgi:hypothetical protein